MTQEALGFMANADRTFIWRLEQGLTQPSLGMVFDLAKALKVDAATLVSETIKGLGAR